MKITAAIRENLREAIKRSGSQSEFSRQTGISQQCVSNWISGKAEAIDDENQARLDLYFASLQPQPSRREFQYVTHESAEVLKMSDLLREKIGVLEERLKLAAERVEARNAVIHAKNTRINELEQEVARLKKAAGTASEE
jgi:phage terminase small subunit